MSHRNAVAAHERKRRDRVHVYADVLGVDVGSCQVALHFVFQVAAFEVRKVEVGW